MGKSVSIIIPHYNTPRQLERLLDSIYYGDLFQVIVVDDKSDNDVELLEDVIKRHPYIEFYRNETSLKNAGVCRNIGLSHAVGEWVLFADADDFFVGGMRDIIFDYVDSAYDIVYFIPTSMDEKTGELAKRHIYYEELANAYISNPCDKTLTRLKYNFCTPWSKLIRRSLFDTYNIRFEEIMVSNDVMCMSKIANCSDEVYVADDILYCITMAGNTLTSKYSEERFDTRVEVDIRRYHYLLERLNKREMRWLCFARNSIDKILVCITQKYGTGKVFWLVHMFLKNKVPLFSLEFLNPIQMCKITYRKILWLKELRKHQ